ncbi:MAG: Fe2+-dependent dioxygenase [Gammaproteobacteria bacterium]|nr:Fe2+-dependent dioxygenase [Gammaproteobacteria bacterium]
MLLHIPNVLTKAQVVECQEMLLGADWVDGKTTAGHLALHSKNNSQLPQDSEVSRQIGDFVLSRLQQQSQFMSAALPNKFYPPMFNCYQDAGNFGNHIDNAIRRSPLTGGQVRTDLSMTLFLTEPDSYDGGELVIEDTYGEKRVKLPAGDLILYPSTSMHRVTPVTQGRRLASFFWLQSLIRSDEQRRTLYELDQSIMALTQQDSQQVELIRLTGVYHNLLRQWSET